MRFCIAEWFNGEFEHRVSDEATVGVRASTITLGRGPR